MEVQDRGHGRTRLLHDQEISGKPRRVNKIENQVWRAVYSTKCIVLGLPFLTSVTTKGIGTLNNTEPTQHGTYTSSWSSFWVQVPEEEWVYCSRVQLSTTTRSTLHVFNRGFQPNGCREAKQVKIDGYKPHS